MFYSRNVAEETQNNAECVCVCAFVVRSQPCGHQSCRDETLKSVRSQLLRRERVSCKPGLLSVSSCADKQLRPRIFASPETQRVTAQMQFEPFALLSPPTWSSRDLSWSTVHRQWICRCTYRLINRTKADFGFFPPHLEEGFLTGLYFTQDKSIMGAWEKKKSCSIFHMAKLVFGYLQA